MRSSIAETTKISSGAKRSKSPRGHAAADKWFKRAARAKSEVRAFPPSDMGDETEEFARKAKGAFVSESTFCMRSG